MKIAATILLVVCSFLAKGQIRVTYLPPECMPVYEEILAIAADYKKKFPEKYYEKDYNVSINEVNEFIRLQLGYDSKNKAALKNIEHIKDGSLTSNAFLEILIPHDTFCRSCLQAADFPYLTSLYNACEELAHHYVRNQNGDSAIYYLDCIENKYRYFEGCGTGREAKDNAIAWAFFQAYHLKGDLMPGFMKIIYPVIEDNWWQESSISEELKKIIQEHGMLEQLKKDLETSFINIQEKQTDYGKFKYMVLYGREIIILQDRKYKDPDLDDVSYMKKHSIYSKL